MLSMIFGILMLPFLLILTFVMIILSAVGIYHDYSETKPRDWSEE